MDLGPREGPLVMSAGPQDSCVDVLGGLAWILGLRTLWPGSSGLVRGRAGCGPRSGSTSDAGTGSVAEAQHPRACSTVTVMCVCFPDLRLFPRIVFLE